MKWTDPGGHARKISPEWQSWREKAHKTVDRYHHKIEAEITLLKDFLIKAVDVGVSVTIDFIMNAIAKLNLDPIIVHLIAGTLDILGNGVLSSLDKSAIWFMWASAEAALALIAANEHTKIEAAVWEASLNSELKPYGRRFFPSGRAWTEAYCESFGGCVPAW